MTSPDLVPCNEPGPIKDLNKDLPPPYCDEQELDCNKEPILESQKEVTGRDFSWLQKLPSSQKTGIGQNATCDPMQTGNISNNQRTPETDYTTLYKYAKSIRGTDEAMMDLFGDIIVIDEGNKEHPVPIVPATQEKAVAYILNENVRNDDSLVVDRIRLPIMAIHSSGITFDQKRYVYHKAVDYLRDTKGNPGFTGKEGSNDKRSTVFGVAKGIPVDIQYTLWVWTMHREDMNQIIEQIIPKFSPIAYIRVRGVSWEIGVKLDSVANNIATDPGDKKYHIFKYQITMTVQTYIPQPLVRKKAVLKTKIELVNSVDDTEVTEVIGRLESALKELQ